MTAEPFDQLSRRWVTVRYSLRGKRLWWKPWRRRPDASTFIAQETDFPVPKASSE